MISAVIAQKDLAAKEKAEATKAIKTVKVVVLTAIKAKAHIKSAGEEDLGLPPSTAPPRLEDAVIKRSRGKTLDYLALHTGKASKKTRPEEGPEE